MLLSTRIVGSFAKENIPLYFGQTLTHPTRSPFSRPRLGRRLRPMLHPDLPYSPFSGGYVPNDPMYQNNWFAEIPGVIDEGEYIHSITTPSIRYDQQSRFENGKMHHYAGFMTIDDLQLTVFNEVGGKAFDIANQWKQNIRDLNGHYALPSSYKKQINLYFLDQNDRIISEVHYLGCWMNSWGSYSLDFGPSSVMVTSLSISVDDIEVVDPVDGVVPGSGGGFRVPGDISSPF